MRAREVLLAREPPHVPQELVQLQQPVRVRAVELVEGVLERVALW